jgi:hypothetical protein
MEKVLDKFFDNSLDLKNRKVFFIWANENWTDNPAFTKTNKSHRKNKKNDMIINNYKSYDFIENSKNLIKYFKNDNYLKINNKPVFFIYHSFLMKDEEIDKFYFILNETCILNGFSGIHFVLNSFEKTYSNYTNFYINFNYKKNDNTFWDAKNEQICLDYKNYIYNKNNIKSNTIQTICFDFNNRVRLFEPNKLKNSTICVDNTEYDKIVFMNKLINTYGETNLSSSRNSSIEHMNNYYNNIDDNNNNNNQINSNTNQQQPDDIKNILLINAFNEWGENMAFEPSNKYKYYNMNLLKEYLTS